MNFLKNSLIFYAFSTPRKELCFTPPGVQPQHLAQHVGSKQAQSECCLPE